MQPNIISKHTIRQATIALMANEDHEKVYTDIARVEGQALALVQVQPDPDFDLNRQEREASSAVEWWIGSEEAEQLFNVYNQSVSLTSSMRILPAGKDTFFVWFWWTGSRSVHQTHDNGIITEGPHGTTA